MQLVALDDCFPSECKLLKHFNVKLLDHARPKPLSGGTILTFFERRCEILIRLKA